MRKVGEIQRIYVRNTSKVVGHALKFFNTLEINISLFRDLIQKNGVKKNVVTAEISQSDLMVLILHIIWKICVKKILNFIENCITFDVSKLLS